MRKLLRVGSMHRRRHPDFRKKRTVAREDNVLTLRIDLPSLYFTNCFEMHPALRRYPRPEGLAKSSAASPSNVSSPRMSRYDSGHLGLMSPCKSSNSTLSGSKAIHSGR